MISKTAHHSHNFKGFTHILTMQILAQLACSGGRESASLTSTQVIVMWPLTGWCAWEASCPLPVTLILHSLYFGSGVFPIPSKAMAHASTTCLWHYLPGDSAKMHRSVIMKHDLLQGPFSSGSWAQLLMLSIHWVLNQGLPWPSPLWFWLSARTAVRT